MKKGKKRILSIVIEALMEIALSLVCLALGLLVLSFMGVDITSDGANYDIAILIGVAIFLVTFGFISLLIHWIKKE